VTGGHGGAPAGATRAATVVIADDQALVRGGFRLILKAAGIDVVAEAADGEQAVAAVLHHQPDVVLMDIRMPKVDGIEATRRIVSALPPAADPASEAPSHPPCADAQPRIIILTTFDLDEYVYQALTAGASGFLLKDVTPEHLVAAIQLDPSITRRLVERFAPVPRAAQPLRVLPAPPASPGAALPGPAGTAGRDLSVLTPRELEVLGLVARGMSTAEIAGSLFLSEATVKTHIARILTKLGLRDRVQAVVLAYECGLVSPGT
jgi:DNA-binding NarL/FixJ family response regulator